MNEARRVESKKQLLLWVGLALAVVATAGMGLYVAWRIVNRGEPDLITADVPDEVDVAWPPERPPRPVIPVRELAEKGRLVLYTFQGRPVTWQDLTGVPFSEVVLAAKRLDETVSEAEWQRYASPRSPHFSPGGSLSLKPGDSLADAFVNSVIENFIAEAVLHEIYRRFVDEQKIDLGKRLDLFYRNINEYARRQNQYLRLLSEASSAPGRRREIYDGSPFLIEAIPFEQWDKAVLHCADRGYTLGSFSRSVCPVYSEETGRVTLYRLRRAQLYPFYFARMDYVRAHSEEYGAIVEEQLGKRDYVDFEMYRLSERRKAESLLRSFMKPDGSIDLYKANQYHRLKSSIGGDIWVATGVDPLEKTGNIYADQRNLMSAEGSFPQARIIPGQLVRYSPTAKQPDRYGFVYVGKKIVAPQFGDYDPYDNGSVKQVARESFIKEGFEKVRPDFVFHEGFPMNVLDIMHASGSESSCGMPREVYGRRFERGLKYTPQEREWIAAYFQQAEKAFGKSEFWPQFFREWDRGADSYAASLLRQHIEKSSIKTPPALDAAARNFSKVPRQ